MVVKKKRRDISELDLGLPDAPSFDEVSEPSSAGMDSTPNFDTPPSAAPLSSPESSLEKLSAEAINALIKDGVPPIPTNFQLYFDRMLEDLPEKTQQEILSMMEMEEGNNDEQTIALESKVKGAFRSIKQLLQISSNLYKNMTLMSRILVKRQSELGKVKDPDLKSIVKTLQADVGKLGTILDKQISNMKNHYQETADIVKEVEQGSIFDAQFGVYNKRYLLTKLEAEAQQVGQFKHNSTIVTVTLTNEIRDLVPSEKAVLLMERTVARLLMKTSRRSDIVAHYSQGVFAMLLKHTDIVNAERASNRLVDLVQSTNFFLGEKEVVLGVNIGIANIIATRTAEETLMAGLQAMKEISLERNKYVQISKSDQL